MDFIYTENLGRHAGLLSLKLKDFPCKHVMDVSSRKAQALLDASLNLGYNETLWGFGEGLYLRGDENRLAQLHIIRRMVYKQCMRPFRVVIDRSGMPWIDNLHSAIRDILVFGDGITLSDAMFYVIDVSGRTPVAIDVGDSLSDNLSDIQGAVDVARKRDMRTDDAVRRIGYSIGDFLSDNNITRAALGLDAQILHGYQLAYYTRQAGGGD